MDTINGLPAHPLLVHIVVIVVPVAAAVSIVSVLWPRARRWLGPTPAVLTLLALIAVPLATSAGEALKESMGVEPTGVLADHVHWGDTVILWVGPLFGLAALWWLVTSATLTEVRGRYLSAGAQRWISVVVGTATVVAAVGALVITIRVGDLGAQAVWGGR